MRSQADRHTPWCDIRNNLAHHVLLIDVNEVDRELHEESVDAFAGNDPETFSGAELFVFQEADRSLLTGLGFVNGIADHNAACHITEAILHRLFDPVIGRFLRDDDIVDVAFAQTGGRDAHEAGFLLQLHERPASAVAHTCAQTADQLIDQIGQRAL